MGNIPKERYLGIYFREGDEDLVQWKADTPEYTDFTRTAIREKIHRQDQEKAMTATVRRMDKRLRRVEETVSRIEQQLAQQGTRHGLFATKRSEQGAGALFEKS